MKKNNIIIVFVIVLTIVIVNLTVSGIQWMYFNYVHTWKYTADYDNYAGEFNIVKEYVLEEFPNETDKWLSVSYTDANGYCLYDMESAIYLECSGEVEDALQKICSGGFPNKDACFVAISIQENRVSFGIENGQYALVYSPAQKPTWVNNADEDNGVWVKKIKDGWYHVTKQVD